MTPATAAERCMIIGCPRDKAEDDTTFCASHRYWAYRVLADPRYRTEKPPEVRDDGSIALPLPLESERGQQGGMR